MSKYITIIAGAANTDGSPTTEAEANSVTFLAAGMKPVISNRRDIGVDDNGNQIRYGHQWINFTITTYPFETWDNVNDIQQDGTLLTGLEVMKQQPNWWITAVGDEFLDYWRMSDSQFTFPLAVIMEDWDSTSEYPSGSDFLTLPLMTKNKYNVEEIG